MSNQITVKMLEAAIDAYAREMGYTRTNYTTDPAGKRHAVIDSLYLDQAYGGYNVFQITSEGGGGTHPLGSGYMTKRELYDRLWTAINAVRAYKDKEQEAE